MFKIGPGGNSNNYRRYYSAKPIAAKLNGIKQGLKNILDLNLTPKMRSEVHGDIKYVSSF